MRGAASCATLPGPAASPRRSGATAERGTAHPGLCRWLAIIATGYCKSHGFFPDPSVALTYKEWGGLAQLGFNQYISNERAIIMIAHVHALGVSAAAAFGPQVLGDTLTLRPDEVRTRAMPWASAS